MKKATFFHAGCPVCVAAENKVIEIVDREAVDLEIVHLGTEQARIDGADQAGVKSVPALVVDGVVLHINHGADLSEVRA